MVLYLAPYIAHNRCPINNSEIIERNVPANYGQKQWKMICTSETKCCDMSI